MFRLAAAGSISLTGLPNRIRVTVGSIIVPGVDRYITVSLGIAGT